MKLSDFKGIFRKNILTVASIENPYEDYYQIKLNTNNLKWIPGDHAIFTLPNQRVSGKKFRAFSIASTPEENTMLLGTRTGKEISSFKKALINLKPGDPVKVTGPFGWFKLQDDHSPIVLIASGVGITPIRALLKEIQNDRPISLIYSSKDFYMFGDELDALSESNPNMTLIKTSQRDETTKHINESIDKYKNKAYYYISGSVPMIKSVKQNMKDKNIKGKRIINDPFYGY